MAKVPTTPTVRISRKLPSSNWLSVALMRRNASVSTGSKACPSSVRANPRGRRLNSVAPSVSSSAFT